MEYGDPTQPFTTQEARHLELARNAGRRRGSSVDQSQPKAPIVADESVPTPGFLKIVPYNTKAKLAFDELITKKDLQELSEHHTQFLVSNGTGPLEKIQPLQSISSDEASDSHQEKDSDSNQVINLGHFRVSFDCLGPRTGAKWSVGRVPSRRRGKVQLVDILLATKTFGRLEQVLAIHAFLQLHHESGAWMILAATGSDKVVTSTEDLTVTAPKATVLVDDQEVPGGASWCLTKPRTRLQIQSMEYSIQFAITDAEEAQLYCRARDRALQDRGIEPPRTRITGIPSLTDICVKGLAILSKGIGSGAFGCVYEGIEPTSGDLRAVKAIELKTEAAGDSLKPELLVTNELGNSPGLVRQYGWRNSNGDTQLKAEHYPVTVYLVQELGLPFHKHNWHQAEWATIDTRLRLCRDLLTGLTAIHAKGWMHRDITPRNILVFKARPEQPQPPRAVLCDFGKLCTHKTHTATNLAAWIYLPPELAFGESRVYHQSIDVWMLALALVLVWYPQAERGALRRAEGQLHIRGIEQIRANMLALEDSGLTLLLRSMLSVNSQNRPSASAALENPCFRNLDVESRKMAKVSDKDSDHD